VPSLVLTAQAVFLLEQGHTHMQTHSHRSRWSPNPHISYCRRR